LLTLKPKSIFMLKKFVAASLLLAVMLGASENASAQRRSTRSSSAGGGANYTNAAGIRLDFGDGTLFGFSGKHFFSEHAAGELALMFGSGTSIAIEGDFQYHVPIQSAAGLQWYAGVGLLAQFLKSYNTGFGSFGGGTFVGIRPMAGLDYKLEATPLNFSFDWRPIIGISQGGGFTAARFGLAARYTF
jgi:hypothetical protein